MVSNVPSVHIEQLPALTVLAVRTTGSNARTLVRTW